MDVSIKDVVVTSSGFKSGAAKYTYRYTRQLKMAQRRLSNRRKGPNRRRRQQQGVARIHAWIAIAGKLFCTKYPLS
jgi:putative transposase